MRPDILEPPLDGREDGFKWTFAESLEDQCVDLYLLKTSPGSTMSVSHGFLARLDLRFPWPSAPNDLRTGGR